MMDATERTAQDVLDELAAEIERTLDHTRQVVREYVTDVSNAEKFAALVALVPGLALDGGTECAVVPANELRILKAQADGHPEGEYACTVCGGHGVVAHGGYYVPGEQFCEPPGEDRCEACVGSGQREVQALVAELEQTRTVGARARAVENGEIKSFPSTGRRDLAADVALFILGGA